MKSLLRQFVLVMIGLLVIAGSVSFMTGCRDKKEKETTEKSVEESYEESDDLWDESRLKSHLKRLMSQPKSQPRKLMSLRTNLLKRVSSQSKIWMKNQMNK